MDKSNPTYIVCNWKMYFPYNQAKAWLVRHKDELTKFNYQKIELIICPSFESLATTTALLKNTSIQIGAQDCSAFTNGAHTGQVSAQSLADLACSYSIIGHSERRKQRAEDNASIAKKINNLIHVGITPILCIGETQQEYQEKKTYSVLEEQLQVITNHLETTPLLVAYEPIWSIGTGIIPSHDYLNDIFAYLHEKTASDKKITLLYGGSVNAKTIESLKKIVHLEGFLIGSASTDFQELKKIVSLV